MVELRQGNVKVMPYLALKVSELDAWVISHHLYSHEAAAEGNYSTHLVVTCIVPSLLLITKI